MFRAYFNWLWSNWNNLKLIKLHDWNAASINPIECEIAIFVSNLYFHTKYKKIIKFDVNYNNLKKLIIQLFNFSLFDMNIFKIYLVYSLIIKGLIITAAKIAASTSDINIILHELSNLIIC